MHSLLWMLLHRCCQALSTFPSRRRCIVVATTRNRCRETPKWTPEGSKIDPWMCQNRAKIVLGDPGASQERPRSAQERPKSAQERPKSAQGAPKSAPRAPQERPRGSKSDFRRRFVARLGRKARFESDRLRDLVQMRVRKKNRHIFEVCAQTRNLDFEKLY